MRYEIRFYTVQDRVETFVNGWTVVARRMGRRKGYQTSFVLPKVATLNKQPFSACQHSLSI